MATPHDIRTFFDLNGYYVARGLFDAETMAPLQRDFDRIVTQLTASGEQIDATWDGTETGKLARAGDTILHTHNVQKYAPSWRNAFLDPRFLDVAEAILGPDIILHHSKLFQKPAEAGAPFPMHQDWPYFPTAHDSMIAAIVHVSEATDEMGCLRVWPGSHKLGRVEGANGRAQNDVLDAHPIEEATPIESQPGDVIFFHYFTLHGSMPNRSDQTRKTVLCQLYAGTDHVEEGCAHPDERMVLRGWNHTISRDAAGEAA
ncbi:phytanoyl-CoA dioxygenase family protein [Primorskyibacter sp. S187A]|uniref:phytanoyl-CoA dioxygenase family protein n=1 Tax=Primorskyibacter sp. S187A TaxID=3415130 RepID=UPI003C7A88A5